MTELERLSRAIEHLETQRSTLGDAVVESARLPLEERISEIESRGGFPELQRKQVTILMMDIVDSTKVASHLDPEDTRDIIDGALQRLAAANCAALRARNPLHRGWLQGCLWHPASPRG